MNIFESSLLTLASFDRPYLDSAVLGIEMYGLLIIGFYGLELVFGIHCMDLLCSVGTYLPVLEC